MLVEPPRLYHGYTTAIPVCYHQNARLDVLIASVVLRAFREKKEALNGRDGVKIIKYDLKKNRGFPIYFISYFRYCWSMNFRQFKIENSLKTGGRFFKNKSPTRFLNRKTAEGI